MIDARSVQQREQIPRCVLNAAIAEHRTEPNNLGLRIIEQPGHGQRIVATDVGVDENRNADFVHNPSFAKYYLL
jgi:hypothetical protein